MTTNYHVSDFKINKFLLKKREEIEKKNKFTSCPSRYYSCQHIWVYCRLFELARESRAQILPLKFENKKFN
jgi:hypothetical protein